MAQGGMVVTPHHLASQTAIMILRQGGTAIEAMVAAAATIAVVYPHMNSIGGDGFWLIVPPNGVPVAIEACGAAGSLANLDFFKDMKYIPHKGPKSAITVAGTIGGWAEALNYATENGHKTIPISELLADAIKYAEQGFPISSSQERGNKRYNTTYSNKEFKHTFKPDIMRLGDVLYQKELANTLKQLANDGLDSFYRGDLAKVLVEDMAALGMPITEADLANYKAIRRTPLKLQHTSGELFNLPPPTQGVLSLSILGMLDELHIDGKNESQFVHAAVEATKQAFLLRDKYITDPKYMTVNAQSLLSNQSINKMTQQINLAYASSEGKGVGPGDTIWMGIMDNKGYSVSFIQSIYHVYGSGVVLPKTGILWQNRGISFNLKKYHIRCLEPGKKPFHTLNPAAALLNDGRIMIYGSRGGDGQPQYQAAIFHRYVVQRMNLEQSVFAPRWLYGPTQDHENYTLEIESRFSEETINELKALGHNVKLLPDFSEDVGQGGALVRHKNGILEGAWDPRSNGFAVGF
ncbi:unnamed protein product [Leptidea sinapis]|uniref:Gamma-glutamyltransferase n=1 Tax=Leptidea sinapis TaxID=189913 RepID=A0A5E4QKE6_9NEOP|nr:unnamed protein product [Leptidea sinapis]